MKTNALKFFGLALMALLTINFSSCEVRYDDFYDDDNIGPGYYNRSTDLCSRTWISNYRDVNGNYCEQQLDFYLDRSGIDYLIVDYRDGSTETFEYRFTWNWDNNIQSSIRMVYGRNDVSYLDDVYIGGNRMNGYLDGRDNYVEYVGRR